MPPTLPITHADRAISVGLLLPTREARVSGRDDPGPLLELAEEAERLAFDSIWVGDSPIARPRLDPLTLLAAVAARTARITLGTAVFLGALRPPVLTAHALASLDRIAGGRLIVGLGAGFPYPATQAEFEAAGVPFESRGGRLMETVAIWRLLWSSGERDGRGVAFRGRYWQFDGAAVLPKPSQPGGPPLWLAGSSPRALHRAGTSFDGWLAYPPTADDYAHQLAAVVETRDGEGWRTEGVTPALYATVALNDDVNRARALLEDYSQSYYDLPLDVMRQVQAFYAGEAAGCAAWLGRYIAAGARHIVLRFATLESPMDMVRRASEELLPAVRRAAPVRRRTGAPGRVRAQAARRR